MKRLFSGALAAVCLLSLDARVHAQGDAKAIVDKGIAAIGGADKIAKAAGASWKAKGTLSFNGNESEFALSAVSQGLDKIRTEVEGDFGGNPFKAVTVLAGDKGWRVFGDMPMELDETMIAVEKRNLYLSIAPMLLTPLQAKGFKIEAAGEEKVDGKPAKVVKVTGPDGKDFKLSFDADSGLPVKAVATVAGFGGDEFTQETTFSDYKDFNGIKKATKVVAKRDGEPFLTQQITEFKLLDSVDAATFKEPS
jgi:hypothetical protein